MQQQGFAKRTRGVVDNEGGGGGIRGVWILVEESVGPHGKSRQ